MSDRELLELAAKAAKYKYKLMCDPVESGHKESEYFYVNNIYCNPLVNDGDALRLAVKLKMLDSIRPEFEILTFNLFATSNDKDPYRAVRRAIVRAAAEIGRQM